MRVFDTLTRRKLEFVPPPHPVRMYVCGITPYDTTHLGHARTYTFFDVVHRYLQFKGFEVRYVQNITDIDDPLFERARSLGVPYESLVQRFVRLYQDDMRALHVLPADEYPKVSDEVPGMVESIAALLDRGHGYVRDGTVYFRVATFPGYGKLSHLSWPEMVEIGREHGEDPTDPHKESPLDFVLWRPSLPDEPRWPSPWGEGRPGWHIECSTFALNHLGNPVDIHGGGYDLIYPHHENEIAQSESLTDEAPFARYWMHVGMVQLGGEKMSKSLGNMVFVEELLRRFSADTVRLYLLSHRYRDVLEFDEGALATWATRVERLSEAAAAPGRDERRAEVDQLVAEFESALDDDFDLRRGIAALCQLADLHHVDGVLLRSAAAAALRKLGFVLGLTFAQ